MPVLGLDGPYPTYHRVMQLARLYVNDMFAGETGTPGEGQILTDSSAFALPILRASTQELYQELGNAGMGVVIRNNYIFHNLRPLPRSNAGIQVFISYTGYFDGFEINPLIHLPPDLVAPIALWERTTHTDHEFQEMREVQAGLPPALQTTAMSAWEWRDDKIWMPGALLPRDIKMRYIVALPLLDDIVDLTEIAVPMQDCEDALALGVAKRYGIPRGSDQYQTVETERQRATRLLKNRAIRRLQGIDYRAEPFGDNRLNLFPLDRYR